MCDGRTASQTLARTLVTCQNECRWPVNSFQTIVNINTWRLSVCLSVCVKVISCYVRLTLDTALPALQGASVWRRIFWYVAIDGSAKPDASTSRVDFLLYYSVDYLIKNLDKTFRILWRWRHKTPSKHLCLYSNSHGVVSHNWKLMISTLLTPSLNVLSYQMCIFTPFQSCILILYYPLTEAASTHIKPCFEPTHLALT
jgi:hypothetical protein